MRSICRLLCGFSILWPGCSSGPRPHFMAEPSMDSNSINTMRTAAHPQLSVPSAWRHHLALNGAAASSKSTYTRTNNHILLNLLLLGVAIAICIALYWGGPDSSDENDLSLIAAANDHAPWGRAYLDSEGVWKDAIALIFRCKIKSMEEFSNCDVNAEYIDQQIWVAATMLNEKPLNDWVRFPKSAQDTFEEKIQLVFRASPPPGSSGNEIDEVPVCPREFSFVPELQLHDTRPCVEYSARTTSSYATSMESTTPPWSPTSSGSKLPAINEHLFVTNLLGPPPSIFQDVPTTLPHGVKPAQAEKIQCDEQTASDAPQDAQWKSTDHSLAFLDCSSNLNDVRAAQIEETQCGEQRGSDAPQDLQWKSFDRSSSLTVVDCSPRVPRKIITDDLYPEMEQVISPYGDAEWRTKTPISHSTPASPSLQ